MAASSTYLVFNNQIPVDIPEQPKEFIESSPSVVYDVNGNIIATFRSFNLFKPVTYTEMPQHLIDAVTTSEDRRFFEHNGADIEGILRAASVVFSSGGEKSQGGSTITQQVARGLYLSPEKSYERKAREVLLAIQLEQVMTKEEILESYLNLAYFGEGAYGIGAAAEIYFGKDVQDLTISESASLVGSIPAPSVYNPRENAELNNDRRITIIGNMLIEGKITQEEYLREFELDIYNIEDDGYAPSKSTVVQKAPRTDYGPFPYFVDAVRREITESFGEELLNSGGLEIYTTLDPATQALAIQKSQEYITGTGSEGVKSSIVMIENDTGFIQAMVGGWDWETDQNNLALGASLGFQPGSSLKPFIYAQALEAGITPTESIAAPSAWTVPECLSGQCTISGGPSGTNITNLTTALKFSYNTPFVILAYEMGTTETANYMKNAGVDVRSADYYSPTLALGAYEVSPLGLASGFTTLAREGSKVAPTAIVKIIKDDTVLVDNTARTGTQVINKGVARWTTEAMFGVTEGGTGRSVYLPGGRIAGKTGTTSDYKAAWFSGYTPEYTTVVWVGNPDLPTTLRNIGGYGNITGGTLPAKIWQEFMTEFLGEKTWEFSVLPDLPQPTEDGRISATTTTSSTTTTPMLPADPRTITQDTVECVNNCAAFPSLPPPAVNTTTTTTVPQTTTTTTSTIPTTTTTQPPPQTFFTTPNP